MILDGLPLFYRTNAEPAPADTASLVHVHGFGISGTYLVPTARRLAAAHATWVPDLPGFGRSHDPPTPLDIDALADVIARFMDQQHIGRATLLGNSLGCAITGAFLERHPDRIDRAILVSPAGGPYNLPIVRGIAQLLLAGTREPLGLAPIAVADYLRFGVRKSWHLARSMIDYPLARRISECTLPTLVVLGDRDPLVSEARVKVRADALPHVTGVTIEGAAHAIDYSHPQQLASVIEDWLQGRPIVGDPNASGRVRVFS